MPRNCRNADLPRHSDITIRAKRDLRTGEVKGAEALGPSGCSNPIPLTSPRVNRIERDGLAAPGAGARGLRIERDGLEEPGEGARDLRIERDGLEAPGAGRGGVPCRAGWLRGAGCLPWCGPDWARRLREAACENGVPGGRIRSLFSRLSRAARGPWHDPDPDAPPRRTRPGRRSGGSSARAPHRAGSEPRRGPDRAVRPG
jgi:hypothetical protein